MFTTRFLNTDFFLQFMANRDSSYIDDICGRLNCKRRRYSYQYLQFLNKFLEITLGSFLGHDVEHLSANSTNLTRLGIAGGFGLLVGLLLGKSNAKETKVIAISCANINKGFNEGLPFADQGAKFVTGDIHTMEVGKNIISMNILAHKLDFAVSLAFITTVEISKGDFENTSLQSFRSNLCEK